MSSRTRLAYPGWLLIVLLAAGCGPSGDDGSEARQPAERIGGTSGTERAAEQVLRKGNGAEPETLDPHRAEGVPAANILRDLYEGLTIEAPNGEVIPGAAESWTVSADSRVYTFRLRAAARWSNGDPVTAEDFVYGLRRSADPATLSEYSAILYPIENAEAVTRGELPPAALGVRAIDARTLEIRLHSPTPYLLGLLNHASTYPVHRPSVEQHGDRFARAGNLVGNGAYRLAEWQVQSHIRLVRNAYYWDDADTVIDEVWYYPLENKDAELKRYRAGELDWTEDLPSRQIAWVKQNLPDELVIAPYLGSYVYGFNVTRPPFKDNLALRKALALAIDREVLTDKISAAGEIPSYSWVPPVTGYTGQQPEWAGWTQAEREAEAQRLYAEAGYSAAAPLRTQLLYNTDDNHKRLAAAIAAMWKSVLGVETELLNQEWKVFLQTRRRKETTEVFRYGWIGDYDDAFSFTELLRSAYGLNDMGYASPQYDALVEQASREGDPVRRRALLEEAERVLLADMPILPIYFYVSSRVVKPWVGGFQPNIMDHHYTKNFYILKH